MNKGLKFALPDKKFPVLDFISSAESGMQKLSDEEKGDLRCYIKTIIDKKYIQKPNMDREELKAFKQLRSNKDIIISQADKGGAVVVMNRLDYEQKMGEILKSDEYQLLNKNPTSTIEPKVYHNFI